MADPAVPSRAWVWGAAAALLWVVLVLRWFDPVEPAGAARPVALSAVPSAILALASAAAMVGWLRARWPALRGPAAPGARVGLLSVLLAVAFRLPLAWHGAAGYVTSDGALSGLVALDIRLGRMHHVFVPHVPYCGSLKSHLAAALATAIDPARAFALASLAFYAVFVAALVGLARRTERGGFVALAAGLYAAFAPPFVTRYSLSNDGNYVEVLALGTLALLLAVRWAQEPDHGPTLATASGLCLGVAFWSHILAVIPLAAVVLSLLVTSPRRALRAAFPLTLGFALGDAPGLLWNAYHGGESFRYLVPGAVSSGAAPGVIPAPLWARLTDHLMVLVGQDFGYSRPIDLALRSFALVALAAALVGGVLVFRDAWRGQPAARVLVVFAAVNLVVATAVLPYIPGNARYLLFLTGPVAVSLGRALADGHRRLLLVVLIAGGAAASLAQAAGTIASDRQWRAFVRDLRHEGVRWCYSDFFIATKITFLSAENVICSSKLGPTTTEYFFRFREEVDAAPVAALVAVNASAAEKLERRLDRLGVAYDRRDFMKPVLLPRSRKVDPAELFPDRGFPLR